VFPHFSQKGGGKRRRKGGGGGGGKKVYQPTGKKGRGKKRTGESFVLLVWVERKKLGGRRTDFWGGKKEPSPGPYFGEGRTKEGEEKRERKKGRGGTRTIAFRLRKRKKGGE